MRESPEVGTILLNLGEAVSVHFEDGLGFREGVAGDGTIALEILDGFAKYHGNSSPVKGIPGCIELIHL